MSAAGDFIVEHLELYGTSVGEVRGTIRDTLIKFPGLEHDDVTLLASELWDAHARFAAVVLLQTRVSDLVVTDLTRLEGFVRSADSDDLVRALSTDVIRPLIASLAGAERRRADAVIGRWAGGDDRALRLAVSFAG